MLINSNACSNFLPSSACVYVSFCVVYEDIIVASFKALLWSWIAFNWVIQSGKKIGFATVKSILDFIATKTFQRLKIKCEITTIFIFYAKRFVYLMQNKLFKLVFVKKSTYFSRCNSILVCYIYLHLGHTLRPKN